MGFEVEIVVRLCAFAGLVTSVQLWDNSAAGSSSHWGLSWDFCGVFGHAASRRRSGVGRLCVLC